MKRLFNLLSAILLAISFPVLASVEMPTISTRIVGGFESAPAQWPAIVSIKTKHSNIHFCGGTLIAKQWVLTAAHCMFDSQGIPFAASDITATVGEYDLASSPTTPATDIERILTHKDYNSDSQINDIALLKLSTPVTNETTTVVDSASTVELIALQYSATVLGWGSTVGYQPDQEEQVTPEYPNILNEVQVPLNTDQQCTTSLGSNYTKEMICAGFSEGGKDACQGDSGGPLMVNTNYGWQQIGIVSWGYGCAAENSPGVYTRLALYADWINYLVKTFTTFSITASTEFLLTPVNSSDVKQLTIENYSDNEAIFTYEIEGSDYFSFAADGCETIAAHSSCQFPVTYAPLDAGSHQATITVETEDIPYAILQTSELYGVPYVVPYKLVSHSSGALGFFTLLLIPLLFIRRYYP